MVPAGVGLKQSLQDNHLTVPLLFTIHLLGHVSLPWHYASEAWCGIKDLKHKVRIGRKRISTFGSRQLWQKFCDDSLERFGCYEADYVTSVSDSYLTDDVYDYVGNVISGKSGHIYNGCDWDYDEISFAAQAGENDATIVGLKDRQLSRWDLRKYLLTQALAQARPVSGQENGLDGPQDRRERGARLVEPFSEDGPLVLMTGRMSPQKGVDILLDAVPLVLKTLPNTRFLLLLLPSSDSDLVAAIRGTASNFPRNVRLVLGRDRPIYLLSHVVADVYAMPSRSEPFGISALEAMVTGNPVVGADIGGIRETVLDIARHGDNGTGVLVPPEDANSLATALVSIIMVMKIDEFSRRRLRDKIHPTQEIPSKSIKKVASKNPLFGSKIRENCRRRVEEKFRWKDAGLMALARYGEAQRLAMGVG
jgi:starch synthase